MPYQTSRLGRLTAVRRATHTSSSSKRSFQLQTEQREAALGGGRQASGGKPAAQVSSGRQCDQTRLDRPSAKPACQRPGCLRMLRGDDREELPVAMRKQRYSQVVGADASQT